MKTGSSRPQNESEEKYEKWNCCSLIDDGMVNCDGIDRLLYRSVHQEDRQDGWVEFMLR